MMQRSRLPLCGGFTLFELLVGMAITAFLFAAVFAAVVSSVRTKELVERNAAVSKVGPVILGLIADDLEQCYVPSSTDFPFFKGDSFGSDDSARDSLQFVTLNSSILTEPTKDEEKQQHAEYIECGYFVEENHDVKGFNTLYRREQFFLEDDPLKGGKFIRLYDLIKSIDIHYWDPSAKQWKDEWSISAADLNDDNKQGRPTNAGQEDLPDNQSPLKAHVFPTAVKIKLVVGIAPDLQKVAPEDIPLHTYETIIHIPTSMRLEYKIQNNNQQNNNNNQGDGGNDGNGGGDGGDGGGGTGDGGGHGGGN